MEPLGRNAVSQRKGPGGSSLSYVNQHYVRRRLCEVFGALGFDTQTVRMERVHGPEFSKRTIKKRDGGTWDKEVWTTVYEATVRVTARDPETGEVSVKEGTAAGVGEDSQIGWSTHLAVTEAETDALKRAAMQLGDSFGLALYDKQQTNVAGPVEQVRARLEAEGVEAATALASELKPSMNRQELRQIAGLLTEAKQNESREAAE